MSDYKWEMQLIAEEAAREEFGKEFEDLPSDVQDKLFLAAETTWVERRMDQADAAR